MSRGPQALIARGEVWDADIPGVGRHPIVVVTRNSAIPIVSSVVCVLATSSFHGHVAEVGLGADEGLDHDSAANCDTSSPSPSAS